MVFSYKHRVAFDDVDDAGIVYYPRFFHYFHLAFEDLLTRVREIPGVRTAGAARLLPLASTMGDSFFRPVGYQPGPNESTQGDWQWATPGYLETMGIPLVEGRAFDERDVRGGRPVVMVNEVIADRYWPASATATAASSSPASGRGRPAACRPSPPTCGSPIPHRAPCTASCRAAC